MDDFDMHSDNEPTTDEELDDEPGLSCVEFTGSSRQNSQEPYQYTILGSDDIVQHMIDVIKEVNTVIELPITTTRILLNYVQWDKEALLEKYYGEDQEKLFKDAHVVSPHTKSNPTSQSKSSRPGNQSSKPTITCDICLLEVREEKMTGLECGHRFCTVCWTEYLTTKILHEGMGDTISCAAHGCDIIVDDQTVMKLILDPQVRFKYQHLITNNFVLCNRLLRWCPSPDCGRAVRVQYRQAQPILCQCSTTFCFECGERWHDPVKCSFLRMWLKKCEDDSETANWIAANTKECPKCHATIEKDGGCNHIICKNQNCRADFCWVCLGPWEPHGSSWYNCNRFDQDEAKKARDAQEKSRAVLQRYLFYCNRYMNHLQSLKFEKKLHIRMRQKMDEMQQHNMSWIEVQFLSKAVDVLTMCRQMLMYTYVFAFYLRRTNQSLIFEGNQADLEQATEQLSEYLERDITQDVLADIKQKVQDKTRYVDQRRETLLKHVHEGYDKDFWEYMEKPPHFR